MKKIKICNSADEMDNMTIKAEYKDKFIFYYGHSQVHQEIWIKINNKRNQLKECWYGRVNDD